MSRMRPVELAKRLRDELIDSPHARDRLIARILSLDIPRLHVRTRGKQYQADSDLSYVIISGVKDGTWKSEFEACTFFGERHLLSGEGTPESRARRLYKEVMLQRELITALGLADFWAKRTWPRIIAALKEGRPLDTVDPILYVGAEEDELEKLVEELNESIKNDTEKTAIEHMNPNENAAK